MPQPSDWRPPPIGTTAPELVRFLAGRRQPTDEFFFKTYRPSPDVAGRFKFDPRRAFFAKTADELWASSDRDIAVLVYSLAGRPIADSGEGELPAVLARTIARPDTAYLPQTGDEESVALRSKVVGAGGERHLPMLDFRAEIPSDAEATARLIEIFRHMLRAIGAPEGVLLESGNSYHYYGYDPVAPEKWRSLMQRSLLLEPLIDVRYVAHRLESGCAALRLTGSSEKPWVPYVVGHIGG